MKVIDLLNKIANGEDIPKKIKIKDEIWTYDDDIDYKASDDRGYLFEIRTRLNEEDLNEELEVIEEDKKIEKLESFALVSDNPMMNKVIALLANKIEEIIEVLNERDI